MVEGAMDVSESVVEDLGTDTNILLSAPALDTREDAACIDLLTPTPPEETNVLSISFTRSPDQRIDIWRNHAPSDLPSSAALVCVNEPSRGAESTAGFDANSSVLDGRYAISGVRSPGDLTTLGIRISEQLDDMREAKGQLTVCFHSLTTLLQYVSVKPAFRFLHVLTSQFRNAGALAHFHLDPSAHDEQTLSTFAHLFDGNVRLEESGDWSVTSR